MKWPRGKYNGKRVAGLSLKVRFNILWWSRPRISLKPWSQYLHFGPIHIWWEPDYEN